MNIESPAAEAVVIYLKAMQRLRSNSGHSANSTEAFLLKWGRPFTPAPLPHGVRRGRMKQCFSNSARLVFDWRSLDSERPVYCEGYAISCAVPIPRAHAWLCDRAGNVIDPTWDWPERNSYFGVPFKTEFLMSMLSRSGHYGLLDCPVLGWPLQRGKHDPVEWLEPID